MPRPIFLCAYLILEIFAGTAKLTSAARRCDLNCDPWDILLGPKFDLLVPRNVRRLLNLVRSRHVVIIWLGTPCVTLSRARKWDGRGPPPLRDSVDVTCPATWITSARDKLAVTQANSLVELSADLIDLITAVGGFYVIENPLTSRLWVYPYLAEALIRTGAVFVNLDFCCWLVESELIGGLPWLKPITLAGTLPGLPSLRKQCSNRHWCSHLQRPHRSLVGKNEHGAFWTKLAEPYPDALCSAVAHLFAAAVHSATRGAAGTDV